MSFGPRAPYGSLLKGDPLGTKAKAARAPSVKAAPAPKAKVKRKTAKKAKRK